MPVQEVEPIASNNLFFVGGYKRSPCHPASPLIEEDAVSTSGTILLSVLFILSHDYHVIHMQCMYSDDCRLCIWYRWTIHNL